MVTASDETLLPEATILAAELLRQYGVRALGHGRMQLYAAVNQRDAAKVHLLTHVCLILMRGECGQEARSA